jgi:hypothetical protein
LRAKGGEFLLAPRNSFAFFEGYPELKRYLDRRYRLIEDDEICQIYDLRETYLTSRARQDVEDCS